VVEKVHYVRIFYLRAVGGSSLYRAQCVYCLPQNVNAYHVVTRWPSNALGHAALTVHGPYRSSTKVGITRVLEFEEDTDQSSSSLHAAASQLVFRDVCDFDVSLY
jgi:hypothetical protein